MPDAVAGLLQAGLLVLALAVCWQPLGDYLARVFNSTLSLPQHSPGAPQSHRGIHASSLLLGDRSLGDALAFDLHLSSSGDDV